MSHIRVPPEVAVSPQDGFPLNFDTDTRTFSDWNNNTWTVDDLAGSRKAQHIKRWLRENYPERKG